MPTPDPTSIISAHLKNAPAIVAGAARARLNLAVACALVELESGGRNVFGGDAGGPFATTPRTEVTPARFVILIVAALVDGKTSNGVGLTQITHPSLIARAVREGYDLTEPEDNVAFGATLLREYIEARGGRVDEAGTLYNAGTMKNGVTNYGLRLAEAAKKWAARLDPPATPTTPSPEEGHTMTPMQRRAEVAAYAETILGRSIDTDGIPVNQPYQCVDVAKHYAHNVHGAPYGAYGNGKDVAWNLSRLPGWKFIPADEPGLTGDVPSWDDPYGVEIRRDGTREVYGHAALLAQDDDGSGRLEVVQANGFTEGAKVHRATLDKDGLRGYARPPRYVAAALAATSPSTIGAAADSYTIRAGDTLWSLSRTFGTTPARLLDLNPSIKDPDSITVGQVIRVKAALPSTLTVKAGEGPWQVAQRAGISLAEFYRLNGREDLHPGDVVKVRA